MTRKPAAELEPGSVATDPVTSPAIDAPPDGDVDTLLDDALAILLAEGGKLLTG